MEAQIASPLQPWADPWARQPPHPLPGGQLPLPGSCFLPPSCAHPTLLGHSYGIPY